MGQVLSPAYEDDRSRVVWCSLITFGYSGDAQIPHRKGVERMILFDRELVVVVMLRFKVGCWLLKQTPYAGLDFSCSAAFISKL